MKNNQTKNEKPQPNKKWKPTTKQKMKTHNQTKNEKPQPNKNKKQKQKNTNQTIA